MICRHAMYFNVQDTVEYSTDRIKLAMKVLVKTCLASFSFIPSKASAELPNPTFKHFHVGIIY